jgi:adenosylcobinamide-phosphate synthase
MELDLAEWLDAAEPVLRDPFVFVCACLALDLILGDPPYRFHPIRLLGRLSAACERYLREAGLDGRFGGFVLFLMLAAASLGTTLAVHAVLALMAWPLAWLWDLYLGYSLLALGDLAAHGRLIARKSAQGDLAGARAAAARLVGRDVDRLDLPACNRAGIESLAENLVDGVISPLFWFVLGGLPGLILFKIASTMDSMVGYKTERYLRFGWFGARLDDVLNWIPSRLVFLLIVLWGALMPGHSGRKAWRVGLSQHRLLPGPNKGWSETAAAGALQVRLAGPIWSGGAMVNETWIGDRADPEGGSPRDMARILRLLYGVTGLFLALILALGFGIRGL